ncbi:MAG: VCBS repeat-containing protein [Thermoanaerobaculia bacterium]
MRKQPRHQPKLVAAGLVLALWTAACGGPDSGDAGSSDGDGPALLLALAALGKNDDGSPKPLPARLGILTRDGDRWRHRVLEDPDSNVFHKAMAYGSDGVLTLGGTAAAVKLWHPDGRRETLWEADFGGKFSRMRDAEIGDVYGDGSDAIVVATHDQGVVAVLRPDGSGGFTVEELDREPSTIVHEIEIGDLDGDGMLEIYATPTAPNKLDGEPQPGRVVRYVPAAGEGRVEVANLGQRHAKEILVTDVDGDGRDELYVSVEAVSGGRVEIRRYDADTDPAAGEVVATLDDRLTRFLTAGDVDGDGRKEIVAATHKNGLWLLRPGDTGWQPELLDTGASSFEPASILLDLDGDGRDELYVASDDQNQVRRYDWSEDGWSHEVIHSYTDGLGRFTWNIMPAPAALLPPG